MKLNKVVELYEAIKSIESNTKLDFKISYRLGRIQDKCTSIIKTFESTQNKIKDKYQKLIKPDDAELTQKLNADFVAEINTLLDIEEEVEVPKFKLSDFENKDIPVKFFSVFSEYIEE